jgi:hypothetical protein
MYSKYADPSNVVHDISFLIPHSVGVEARSCEGQDVIDWRQSNTTAETLQEKLLQCRSLKPIPSFWNALT